MATIQPPRSSLPAGAEPPAPPSARLDSSDSNTITSTMAGDDGQVDPAHRLPDQQHFNGSTEKPRLPRLSIETLPELDAIPTLMSPRHNTMNPFRRVHNPLEIDDYFVCFTIFTPTSFISQSTTNITLSRSQTGPRDTQKHSKWPLFMQMHGSILPKMMLPLLGVGAWTTMLTVINFKVTNCALQLSPLPILSRSQAEANIPSSVGIHNILLTVLGFVVGMGLSFRSSTAYERYSEGRRYWASLLLACQTLGRVYWVHAKEREGELGKKDVLAKL